MHQNSLKSYLEARRDYFRNQAWIKKGVSTHMSLKSEKCPDRVPVLVPKPKPPLQLQPLLTRSYDRTWEALPFSRVKGSRLCLKIMETFMRDSYDT